MALSRIPLKTAPDFTRSGVSRYLQLAALFRRRIESGEWAFDSQIPTVDDLSAECGVARATIRQALGLLEKENLIARYRARGTFVTHRPAEKLWCDVSSDISGLLRAREGAVIEILSEEKRVQPRISHKEQGTLAPAYRHLRRRHWRDTQPFLLADVYIDERLCSKIPKAAFTSKTALRLVADIPGLKIVDACQTLTIGAADVATADMLEIPLNAPVAFVHRSATDSRGCQVLIAQGIYRGDVVRVDIKLK
jgi:GntR family transcriptional regulator